MNWRDFIGSSPTISAGKPFIKGTTVLVEEIFERLAEGKSEADIRLLYPGLPPETITACFRYASEIIPDRLQRRASPSDAKLHVGGKILEKAFNRHRQVGEAEDTDSHLLLLIYAIECGLKRILLHKRGVHTTERLEEDDFTHDLDSLLKTLGVNKSFGQSTIDEPKGNAAPWRIHEALRYGARFSNPSRMRIINVARDVISWIEENL